MLRQIAEGEATNPGSVLFFPRTTRSTVLSQGIDYLVPMEVLSESIHHKSALNQVSARVLLILVPSSKSLDSPQLAVLTSFKSIDNGL